LALCPIFAHAWGNLLLMDEPPVSPSWSVGASVWSLPTSPGADRKQATLLPAVEWRNDQGLFASTDSGVGWNVSRDKATQWGLRLWPQLGRRSGDAPRGIGGIGPKLQAEAFANHALTEALLLQSGLLLGAGEHRNGMQVEWGATSGLPLGPGPDVLAIGVSATYANGPYRRAYFGISPAQSSRSGLPGFNPGGGLADRCITLSFEHKVDAHWRVDLQAMRARLASRLQASPLGVSSRQSAATASVWHDF
jgi:outer membrane scaffolding protein for murein synthesis (MipA/OmpV family)